MRPRAWGPRGGCARMGSVSTKPALLLPALRPGQQIAEPAQNTLRLAAAPRLRSGHAGSLSDLALRLGDGGAEQPVPEGHDGPLVGGRGGRKVRAMGERSGELDFQNDAVADVQKGGPIHVPGDLVHS